MGNEVLKLRLDLRQVNTELIDNDIHIEEVLYSEIPVFLIAKEIIFGLKVYSIRVLDYIFDTLIRKKNFIYYFSDNLIGICGIKFRGKKAFLFDFGIMPEYRGKGLSRLCLLKIIEQLKREGIEELELKVRIENYKALNLYTSLGFIET